MAWTDIGGGDHGGDDWSPAHNTIISGYHYNIGTFHIQRNISVYLRDNTEAESAIQMLTKIDIRAKNILIEGTLNGNETGYHGGRRGSVDGRGDGPGGGKGHRTWGTGGGAGYSTAGQEPGGPYTGYAGLPYGTYGSDDISHGSGGGAIGNYDLGTDAQVGKGGRGGGCIILRGDNITIGSTGIIQANGGPGALIPSGDPGTVTGQATATWRGASGSGGGILIVAVRLTVDSGSVIEATGGDPVTFPFNTGMATYNYTGGGGAAGRIKIYAYYKQTGTGTVPVEYIEQWTNEGGGDHGGEDWYITDSTIINGLHYNIRHFVIASGATVSQSDMTASEGTALEIRARTIEIGGNLTATGKGYIGGRAGLTNGNGPGGGKGVTNGYGGGGGYGWIGEPGSYATSPDSGGTVYGTNVYTDITFGSGGGAAGPGTVGATGNGGSGGGCIILRAEFIRLVGIGSITANGTRGEIYSSWRGGSGSGGGILLITKELEMSAGSTIYAVGGAGTAYAYGALVKYAGAGGGGRVKLLLYDTDVPTSQIVAKSGAGLAATATPGPLTKELGQVDGTYNIGYKFIIDCPLPVAVDTIKTHVREVTTAGTFLCSVYDSVEKTTLLGQGSATISAAGDVVFTMSANEVPATPHIKLHPLQYYYIEITRTGSGNVSFSMCDALNEYVYAVRNGYEIYATAPHMVFEGYGHVSNAALYNDVEPNIKENLASCLPVGAVVVINADGTGSYTYRDNYTTYKYKADSYNASLVVVQSAHNWLAMMPGGYVIYKIPVLYPIVGTPTIRLDFEQDTNYGGGGRVMVAKDTTTGETPTKFWDIDDELIENTDTTYELKSAAGGVYFDGETVIWIKIYSDMMSAVYINDLQISAVLDTNDAQLISLTQGSNTLVLEQQSGVYAAARIDLQFRERKLG